MKIDQCICPACRNTVLILRRETHADPPVATLLYPRAMSRTPVPPEVPPSFADDYREACLVLADSPKASAALSRRCLQHVLQEKAGATGHDLSKQIAQVIGSGVLPTDLADAIDAVRNIGNFAAHPIKSQHTGEVVDVEAGEAEWLLDVVEELFEFYFVRPAVLKRKREVLDSKLESAGKPVTKGSDLRES